MADDRAAAVRVVLTTAPSAEVAERIADTVVEERLAACASVVPGVTSIYRWEGEVQRDAEVLVIVKTTAAAATHLAARLVELHPYEVPEVLDLGVESGHGPYLDWVRSETDARP